MRIIPSKKEWISWSLLDKLSAIGTYIGILGLLITLCTGAIQFLTKNDDAFEINISKINLSRKWINSVYSSFNEGFDQAKINQYRVVVENLDLGEFKDPKTKYWSTFAQALKNGDPAKSDLYYKSFKQIAENIGVIEENKREVFRWYLFHRIKRLHSSNTVLSDDILLGKYLFSLAQLCTSNTTQNRPALIIIQYVQREYERVIEMLKNGRYSIRNMQWTVACAAIIYSSVGKYYSESIEFKEWSALMKKLEDIIIDHQDVLWSEAVNLVYARARVIREQCSLQTDAATVTEMVNSLSEFGIQLERTGIEFPASVARTELIFLQDTLRKCNYHEAQIEILRMFLKMTIDYLNKFNTTAEIPGEIEECRWGITSSYNFLNRHIVSTVIKEWRKSLSKHDLRKFSSFERRYLAR